MARRDKASLDFWYHWDHRPHARRIFESLRQRASDLLAHDIATKDPSLVGKIRDAVAWEMDVRVRKPRGIVDPWGLSDGPKRLTGAPSVSLFGLELTALLGSKQTKVRLAALQRAMALLALESPPESALLRGRDALKPPIRALRRALDHLRLKPWPPASLVPAVTAANTIIKDALVRVEALAADLASQKLPSRNDRLRILLGVDVQTKDISAYLGEMGYDEKQASVRNITQAAYRLRLKGFEQPVAATALNKERPKTGRKKT